MSVTNLHSLIGNILKETLGLLSDDYTSQELTAATNNSVFRIDLVAPVPRANSASSRPCTSSIPAGTKRLVIRISNPHVNLHYPVRLRNEVAFLHLGGKALSSLEESLVPRVFAWSDNEVPWILEEWKHGKILSSDEFNALSEDKRSSILKDIAQVVKLFQDFELPEGISYGGLTFDDSGIMSSAASVIPCGGPKAYDRLLAVKAHGPRNHFWCHQCVGNNPDDAYGEALGAVADFVKVDESQQQRQRFG